MKAGLTVAAALAGLVAPVLADEATLHLPPIIGDAIEQSLTGAPGDPARGQAVVTSTKSGNCLLCHALPVPREPFQGNIGPDLAGVGARLTEGQIRLRLVDQTRLNPQTTMPAFYRVDGLNRVMASYRGKPVLTAAEIEDAVAYLAKLRDQPH